MKTPSHTTIRRWINLYGYSKLISPKAVSDDWIYILDNSIRAENRKVCLILGVRASMLKKGSYIGFKDVEVLELRLINKNHEVAIALEKAISKTSPPIQIISDEGSDILPSIKKIQMCHPNIKHVPDMMHKVGNMLRKKLEDDERWIKFVDNLKVSKNKLKQSKFSHLSPPNLRMKQRFLNSQNAVQWAWESINLLKANKEADPELIAKLGWLCDQENDVRLFKELFEIAQASREIARKLHIEKNGELIAKQALEEISNEEEGKQFANTVINFMSLQCSKASETLLLGSSEIIESAFSKLKTLDRECGNGGFTKSIIGLAACFGDINYEFVNQSFNTNSYKDFLLYANQNIGETIYTKRRKLYQVKNNVKKELASKLARFFESKTVAA